MKRCAQCSVDIEGPWGACPLCGTVTAGEASPDPFPAVSLEFSRRRVFKILFLTSLAVILASLGAQLLFNRGEDSIGVLRSLWLGVTAMWLVVVMAVRKRRNVAKGTVYLVVLVGLLCVYWDYLTAWHGWSLTYAVPSLCACSIVALLITVQIMHIEVGEHVVHTGLAVLLGLAPIGFLGFGWVADPLPSVVCGVLSLIALALLVFTRGAEVRHELAKRLHL
ncbi:DUF6320 domain-containing protein [Brevibacterium yomogidense]|uniref:DUF6320 domain-containing protein n=1 Tax=Brevibacterium yomogidense TaxID=946573 RepID=UPI0018DF6B02|nr:DUF6320 domain-containing protein [Brevibacterium yomogidense]